jgi:hypothetical protein
LLVAVLAVGGCGGSDDSSSGAENGSVITVSSGSLSKADFVRQADAICKEARRQYDDSFNEFAKTHKLGGSPGEWVGEVVDTILIPTYEKQIDQINALGAPSGDEKEVSSFLNALQKRLDSMHKTPTELGESLTPFEKPAALAKAYGLAGCAASLS